MSWLDSCSCKRCGRIPLILTVSRGLVLCKGCRKELIKETGERIEKLKRKKKDGRT